MIVYFLVGNIDGKICFEFAGIIGALEKNGTSCSVITQNINLTFLGLIIIQGTNLCTTPGAAIQYKFIVDMFIPFFQSLEDGIGNFSGVGCVVPPHPST